MTSVDQVYILQILMSAWRRIICVSISVSTQTAPTCVTVMKDMH